MKKKINIPLIALIVSIVAVLFSIATLIKCIIQGQNIFIAVLGVIGTALIMGVCLLIIYLNKAEGSEEDVEEDSEEKEEVKDEEESNDEEVKEEKEEEPEVVEEEKDEEEIDEDLSDIPKAEEE